MKKTLFSVLLCFMALICFALPEESVIVGPVPDNDANFGWNDTEDTVKRTIRKESNILPIAYDLRDYGLVTPIRNQKPLGTCWAFSTMAALESNALKKYGVTDIFSPIHLVRNNIYPYVTTDLSHGGNGWVSMGYFMALTGPVKEEDSPYVAPSYLSGVGLSPVGYVKNIVYINDGKNGLSEDELIAVKNYLMNNGAMQISFFYDDECISDNDLAYYYPEPTDKTNHGVTIVGWDDNYPKENFKTTPPGDGALLIKNSWGTGRHDNGFVWISYYDTSLNKLFGYEFSQKNESEFNKSLGYDTHYTIWNYSEKYRYGKIIYNPETEGEVTSVRLYCMLGDNTINAVVTNNTTGESQSISVDFPLEGIKISDLPEPVSYSPGDELELVMDYNAGEKESYCFKSEYPAEFWGYTPSVVTGKNFVSKDGTTWIEYSRNLIGGLYVKEDISDPEIIKLNKIYDVVKDGSYIVLEPTVSPAGAKEDYIWSSDDEDIATVNNGLVQGVGYGETTIRVCSAADQKVCAECKVFSYVNPVNEVTIITPKYEEGKTEKIDLYSGQKCALNIKYDGLDGMLEKCLYGSSVWNCCAVDGNGVITAKKPGTTTITATAKDNEGAFDTVEVEVHAVPVKGISLDRQSADLDIDESITLISTISPESVEPLDIPIDTPLPATNQKVIWSSENWNVAKVVSGVVTGKNPGTAVITAKTEDGGFAATCTITVKASVTSVEILGAEEETVMYVGDVFQLSAKVLPEIMNQSVSWSSDNWNTARVINGVVTAKNPGAAKIYVSSKLDPEKQAYITVIVKPIPVTDIELVNYTEKMTVGDSMLFTAKILPETGNQKITWTTDNWNVAKVISGVVTAKKPGTAIITGTSVAYPEKSVHVQVEVFADSYIELNALSVNLGLGKMFTLTVKTNLKNPLVFSLDNDIAEVISIDSGYVLIGKAKGEAVLTVKGSGEEADCSATCRITVE